MTKEELTKKVENFLRIISKDRDRLYFICTKKAIGDYLMAGGFSEAVQKRKNKKSTVLVINHTRRCEGLFFPNISETIGCDADIMGGLEDYFQDTKNYEGDNYIYANFHKTDEDKPIWDRNLSILERFKKNALNLPMDTPFNYPIVDEISDENIAALHKKYILDKNRTIILVPHANTFRNTLGKDFWVNMAKRLKEKNYIVYSNVAGDEEPVEGIEPFNANFPELYYITDKVKYFIGLRSGIFDFLAMTVAKMITVNIFPNWFMDISVIFPECDNQTFYTTNSDFREFKKNLGKYDISAEIKYSISNLNIFYSDDDLLEKILCEV